VVKFGTTAATITADSATSLTATAPAEAAGTVDVTVTTAGGTSATSAADQYTFVGSSGAPYSPLAPVRICDTRPGNASGLSGAATQCNGTNNVGSTLVGGVTKKINVAGSFGVPSGATAVVLNVTVVGPVGAGFVSVFPAGAALPTASNVNYVAGEVVPNLVEVGTGTSGQVSFYSSQAADIVVDVEGYSSPTDSLGAGAGLYNTLGSPARLCDTRAGNPSGLTAPDNQCNGDTLANGGTIPVQVAGDNGIPSNATAAVLNLTVVNPVGAGFLTVYPQGSSQPTASNVNYGPGQVTANRVIVPLSATGQISVYSSAAADVVVDVSGYYSAAGGSGTQFSAEAAPVRICDTRSGNPSGLIGPNVQCGSKTIGPSGILKINVANLAGVPPTAKAVVVNLTGVAPTAPTFLTVFPGPALPTSSDLNPAVGEVRANLVVATLNTDGSISVFNLAGNTNTVVDVLGWYS
jgi:hypothetical protein